MNRTVDPDVDGISVRCDVCRNVPTECDDCFEERNRLNTALLEGHRLVDVLGETKVAP